MKIRLLFLGLTAFVFSSRLMAQQNVGIGTATPNAAAVLDIVSTNKGILIPRVETSAIVSPVNGLLVFQPSNQMFYYYAAGWKSLGGVIDADGDTKIVANDLPTNDEINITIDGINKLVLRRNALGDLLIYTKNASTNTFVGDSSGVSITTGIANTAFGNQNLKSLTSGNNNTAFGSKALWNATTHSDLVAIGDSALFNNGLGLNFQGAALGNTAIGSKVLQSNTEGFGNTGIGTFALQKNIIGRFNTAVGESALRLVNQGSANSAIGQGVLSNLKSGAGNTGLGVQSLAFLDSGSNNTAVGWRAGIQNINGNNNVFLGSQAGYYELGSDKLYIENTDADSNGALVFGNFQSNLFQVNGHIKTISNSPLQAVVSATNTATTANDIPAVIGTNSSYDFFGIGVAGIGGWKGVVGSVNGQGANSYYGVEASSTGINSGTNYGVYAKAANGNKNYAGYFENNVAIGNTPTANNAILELTSTTKGFLPPRLTHAQKSAIVNPEAGLQIWCSDCGGVGQMQVFNGIVWTNIIGGEAFGVVGSPLQGGKIAYFFQPGQPGYVVGESHGIIAATSDMAASLAYGCSVFIPGADDLAIGSGALNSSEILATCSTAPAALACANYVSGAYSDWHLPSQAELQVLFNNRVAIGGFDLFADYWSSTENGNANAYKQNFNNGISIANGKNSLMKVRAVRYF